MSNLVKLEFAPLLVTGSNYVPWSVDVKMHLKSKSLIETLSEKNNSTESENASSLVFIRRHIDESLKNEHLTVEDPSELWKNLKDRYDHQKDMMLPKYRDAWNNLRFQDFKKVSDYNFTMYDIISHLKYCGEVITDEQKVEKTLSTFHASNIVLQQQYRLRGFKEYSQLITNLLVAEEYNELLIKNHQSRPTGSKAFTEANFANSDKHRPINNFTNRSRGRTRGRGRGRNQGHGRGGYFNNLPPRTTNPSQKRNHDGWNQGNSNKHEKISISSNAQDSVCHRCGLKNHWAKQCRTPEHFAKLYKESVARKGKAKEANFIDGSSDDLSRFETPDFQNDFGNIRGDFTDAKEVHYVDRDPIYEYTRLGESDFDYDLSKIQTERDASDN